MCYRCRELLIQVRQTPSAFEASPKTAGRAKIRPSNELKRPHYVLYLSLCKLLSILLPDEFWTLATYSSYSTLRTCMTRVLAMLRSFAASLTIPYLYRCLLMKGIYDKASFPSVHAKHPHLHSSVTDANFSVIFWICSSYYHKVSGGNLSQEQSKPTFFETFSSPSVGSSNFMLRRSFWTPLVDSLTLLQLWPCETAF